MINLCKCGKEIHKDRKYCSILCRSKDSAYCNKISRTKSLLYADPTWKLETEAKKVKTTRPNKSFQFETYNHKYITEENK